MQTTRQGAPRDGRCTEGRRPENQQPTPLLHHHPLCSPPSLPSSTQSAAPSWSTHKRVDDGRESMTVDDFTYTRSTVSSALFSRIRRPRDWQTPKRTRHRRHSAARFSSSLFFRLLSRRFPISRARARAPRVLRRVVPVRWRRWGGGGSQNRRRRPEPML